MVLEDPLHGLQEKRAQGKLVSERGLSIPEGSADLFLVHEVR